MTLLGGEVQVSPARGSPCHLYRCNDTGNLERQRLFFGCLSNAWLMANRKPDENACRVTGAPSVGPREARRAARSNATAGGSSPRQESFQCWVCDKAFRTEKGLKIHKARMRHRDEDVQMAQAPEGKFEGNEGARERNAEKEGSEGIDVDVHGCERAETIAELMEPESPEGNDPKGQDGIHATVLPMVIEPTATACTWVERTEGTLCYAHMAPSASPAPLGGRSVKARASADSHGVSAWVMTGARPKDRRVINSLPDQASVDAAEEPSSNVASYADSGEPVLGATPAVPSGQPAPLGTDAANARDSADSVHVGSVWMSTGVGPRVRRKFVLPPDLRSSDDEDEGGEPVFCGSPPGEITQRSSMPKRSGNKPTEEGSENGAATGCSENAAPADANMTGHISTMTTTFQCPECTATFGSKIGLSQHRRHRHFEEYNEDVNLARLKPRWKKEEEYLMATKEVELRSQKVRDINAQLLRAFPHRTLHSIKSHRRQEGYKRLVEDLQNRLYPRSTQEVLADIGEQAVEDASLVIPEVNHREVIEAELRGLTTKPPPRAYQAYKLWELAKRFLDREDITIALNAYLREVFASDLRPHGRQPLPPVQESRRKKKKREYALTQQLFRRNRTQCARQILDGEADSKVEDPQAFLEEWREIMEKVVPSSVSPAIERPHKVIDPVFLITEMDIKAAMPSSSSAAGPDGFAARELRKVPPVILQVLLNLLLLLKRLPLFLTQARTIFIPKVPGASTASQHRPISISHVLLRLLHKIYFRRLLADLDLDLQQRAFLPVDGCAENILLLATIIDEARKSLRPLSLASLDIAKAFDRVVLPAILRALRRKGISEDFISYIEDFYQNAVTVLTFGGKSLVVHPTVGVRQGDPLSPLLFNLVIDEFLAELDPQLAFTSEGMKVSAMAFADDIILTTATHWGLKQQIDRLNSFLGARGLKINAAKSTTLVIEPSGWQKRSKIRTDIHFFVNGERLATTNCTSTWRYLGVHFGVKGLEKGLVRRQLAILLERVSKAPLKPQQRLVVLRFYLLPRLYHRLVLGPISAKTLLTIDRVVRSAVRRWLALPLDAPLGFFYAAVEEGGLGVPCFRTVVPAMRLRRYQTVAQSSNPACAFAATRPTITQLKRQADNLTIFKGTKIGNSKQSRKYWARQLHMSFDGRPLQQCKEAPGSTSWLGNGTSLLRGREFIDLAKFHVAAVPNLTRLRRGRELPKQCRAGCQAEESLGHILQRCHRTHHARIKRHDNILRYLAGRLTELGWQVQQERHFKTSQGTKIPDLVIIKREKSHILDVQVVSTRVELTEAHHHKCDKYKIPDLLFQVSPTPTVSSVTLSYRGTWAGESVRTLQEVGLTRNDFKMMTIRCLQGGLAAFKMHQMSTAVVRRGVGSQG